MDSRQRQLKREWKDGEREAARKRFPLPDDQLEALFKHVERALEKRACDHSLRWTEQWIASQGLARERLLEWLRENGGFCDCEVVANACDHWDQNRTRAPAGN